MVVFISFFIFVEVNCQDFVIVVVIMYLDRIDNLDNCFLQMQLTDHMVQQQAYRNLLSYTMNNYNKQ